MMRRLRVGGPTDRSENAHFGLAGVAKTGFGLVKEIQNMYIYIFLRNALYHTHLRSIDVQTRTRANA